MQSSSNHNDTPPQQVRLFQWLWFGGMVFGAAYDCVVAVVGDRLEALIDILMFSMAAILLHYAVRMRSNFARLLVVPFLAVTIIEILSHEGVHKSDQTTWLAIVQLGLMCAGGWLLFTSPARRWFAQERC